MQFISCRVSECLLNEEVKKKKVSLKIAWRLCYLEMKNSVIHLCWHNITQIRNPSLIICILTWLLIVRDREQCFVECRHLKRLELLQILSSNWPVFSNLLCSIFYPLVDLHDSSSICYSAFSLPLFYLLRTRWWSVWLVRNNSQERDLKRKQWRREEQGFTWFDQYDLVDRWGILEFLTKQEGKYTSSVQNWMLFFLPNNKLTNYLRSIKTFPAFVLVRSISSSLLYIIFAKPSLFCFLLVHQIYTHVFKQL